MGAGTAIGAYLATVGLAWARYGHTRPAADAAALGNLDVLLDRFIPHYDIVERHHVRVAAPADVTLQAARDIDLSHSPVVRAIFKGREWIMRSHGPTAPPSQGFVADMQAIGWGVLADEPGHELVMGGVTKPWEANPTFRALPPDDFRHFDEPGLVKIAFTLRADPLAADRSVFRTETRAVATDQIAREKFKTYWAFLSPGIVLIRWAMLRPVKTAAERRFRLGGAW